MIITVIIGGAGLIWAIKSLFSLSCVGIIIGYIIIVIIGYISFIGEIIYKDDKPVPKSSGYKNNFDIANDIIILFAILIGGVGITMLLLIKLFGIKC